MSPESREGSHGIREGCLAGPPLPAECRRELLRERALMHAVVQPYSGHASRQSPEVYAWLAIGEAQQESDHWR